MLSCEFVKVGVRLGIGRIDLIKALARLHDRSQAFLDRLTHRVLRIQLGLLREVTDVQARHRHCFALDLLVHTGHDFEQGGLARAVESQHADLGAREKRQGDVAQDLTLGRNDFADPVHGVDVLSHKSDLLPFQKRRMHHCRLSRI